VASTQVATATSGTTPIRAGARGRRRGLGLGVLLVLLLVATVGSVVLGTRDVDLGTIWQALTNFDGSSTAQTVIAEMRIPRTLVGITAGVGLGLSGAILQASTRNPLADPGIMGINGGAAAAIVMAITLLGTQTLSVYIWFGFAGAGLAVVAVYSIASFGREGATPVKLALAGAAISAGLFALVSALVLIDIDAFDELRFWQVGSLAGRYWPVFWQTLPFLLVGSIVALFSGRALNGLALGDDVAAGHGIDVRRTRFRLFVLVAVLCGAAVSACGPIIFLGLAVPQAARALVGPDYRWVLAYTAVMSPIVLLVADVIGRVAAAPGELQVGVVLGVLGAPVFILLVRYRNLSEL
jgi:iron complex transport system permease protein